MYTRPKGDIDDKNHDCDGAMKLGAESAHSKLRCNDATDADVYQLTSVPTAERWCQEYLVHLTSAPHMVGTCSDDCATGKHNGGPLGGDGFYNPKFLFDVEAASSAFIWKLRTALSDLLPTLSVNLHRMTVGEHHCDDLQFVVPTAVRRCPPEPPQTLARSKSDVSKENPRNFKSQERLDASEAGRRCALDKAAD